MQVSEAEIQERADQFRRVRGLHRASDTNKYLNAMRISLEEFEAFITDSLYQEKMMRKVCSEQAVQGYFKLNSPKFDSIEVSHIVLDSEAKAKEMIAVLGEDPDSFEEMAREHSIADTREQGGLIGKLLRGSLRPDVEAKVFNAAAGDLLGPFAVGGSDGFRDLPGERKASGPPRRRHRHRGAAIVARGVAAGQGCGTRHRSRLTQGPLPHEHTRNPVNRRVPGVRRTAVGADAH